MAAIFTAESACLYLAECTVMVGIEGGKDLLHLSEPYASSIHSSHLTLAQRQEISSSSKDGTPPLCLCACSEHTTARQSAKAARN